MKQKTSIEYNGMHKKIKYLKTFRFILLFPYIIYIYLQLFFNNTSSSVILSNDS